MTARVALLVDEPFDRLVRWHLSIGDRAVPDGAFLRVAAGFHDAQINMFVVRPHLTVAGTICVSLELIDGETRRIQLPL